MVIEVVQLVSSLMKTYKIRWPRVQTEIMGKLRVLQLDFLHLPAVGCNSPGPTFFAKLNGEAHVLAAFCVFLFQP